MPPSISTSRAVRRPGASRLAWCALALTHAGPPFTHMQHEWLVEED